MANIKESLKLLAQLEYTNNPSKFLHKNRHEHTLTVGGIYTYANPTAIDNVFVQSIVLACKGDTKRASVMLYHDKRLNDMIEYFCKHEVWDKLRLDQVHSQKVADELFLFAFHTHYKTAAKVAQRLVGVKDDGVIGPKSLKALNSFDVNTFDIVYDEKEEEHYKAIIERKPYLQTYYDGWVNRANAV